MIETKSIKSNAIICAISNLIELKLKELKLNLFYDRNWLISDDVKKIEFNRISKFDIIDYYVKDTNDYGLVLFYKYDFDSFYRSKVIKLYKEKTHHMLQYEKLTYYKSNNILNPKFIKQLGDNGTSIHIEWCINYYNNFNGKVLTQNEYDALKYATKYIDFTPYSITILYERKF